MNFLSNNVKPFVWVCAFLSTLMFLNLYDAESFFLSFIVLMIGNIGTVLYWPKDKALSLTKSPVLLLLLAFWALAFISVLFSEIAYTSFIFFCFLGTLPLAFIFAVTGENKDHFFRVVFGFSACFYAALSLLCLLQYFFAQHLLSKGLTSWPMANPNSLSGFLSLGFFCSYGAFLHHRRTVMRVLFFALSVLIVTAMYTTGGRGALASLIVGFVIFSGLLFTPIKPVWKAHAGFVFCAVASFILLAVFTPEDAHQPLHEEVLKTINGTMPVLWTRPQIWLSTWHIIQEHFWLGTGVGTFSQYYPEYRGADYATSGHMAHNDLLQFWSEMGVFSPLIFLALIGAAIYKTVRVLNLLDKGDNRRILIATPFCAFGAMVLHTQISFHFYVLPILFVAGTLLAFWFVQTQRVEPSGRWAVTAGSVLENRLVKLCSVLLLVCCGFMFVCFQGSEILTDRAKTHMLTGDVGRFAAGINAAGKLSFNRNARALALAGTVPSGVMRAQGQALPKSQQIELFRRADDLFNRAIRYNPRLASAYHEKALIAEHALQYFPEEYSQIAGEDAPTPRQLVETALRLNPLHAGTRVKLAQILIGQGQKQAAFDVLRQGLGWPYFSDKAMHYYQMTASVARDVGDDAVRDEALEKIAALQRRIARQRQRNEYRHNSGYLRFLLVP